MDSKKSEGDLVTDGKSERQEGVVNNTDGRLSTISDVVAQKSPETPVFKNPAQALSNVRITTNEEAKASVRSSGSNAPELADTSENATSTSSVVPVVRGGTIAAIPKASAPGLVAALRATGVAVVPASTPSIPPMTSGRVAALPPHTPRAAQVSIGVSSPATTLAKLPAQRSRPPSPGPSQPPKSSLPRAPQLPLLPIPSQSQFLKPPPLPPHPQTQPQSYARSPPPFHSLHSPALGLTPSPTPSSSPISNSGALAAAGANPAAVAAAAVDLAVVEKKVRKKMEKLETKLRDLEDEIETEEKDYIAHTWAHGNVIRGWEDFLNRTERASANKSSLPTPKDKSSSVVVQQKFRKARPSDHIFSLSSSSSKFRRDHPDITIPKRPTGISKRKKKRGG